MIARTRKRKSPRLMYSAERVSVIGTVPATAADGSVEARAVITETTISIVANWNTSRPVDGAEAFGTRMSRTAQAMLVTNSTVTKRRTQRRTLMSGGDIET